MYVLHIFLYFAIITKQHLNIKWLPSKSDCKYINNFVINFCLDNAMSLSFSLFLMDKSFAIKNYVALSLLFIG